MRTFPYQPAPCFQNLFKFDNEFRRLDIYTTLVARGNIVIGWVSDGLIRPLYDRDMNRVFYYLNTCDLVRKAYRELEEMGVFSHLPDHISHYEEFPNLHSGSTSRRTQN